MLMSQFWSLPGNWEGRKEGGRERGREGGKIERIGGGGVRVSVMLVSAGRTEDGFIV